MNRRTESSVEVFFAPTRDGLIVSRVALRPVDDMSERDLRLFAERVTHGLRVPVQCRRDGEELPR